MTAEPTPPFISVMILCYNNGHLLGKALGACAAQTFQDFEIVMVNNGSADNTEEVYREFCRKHPDIQTVYVHIEPNKGVQGGWNQALKHARGEYVMFNDADDWMEPDCLELLAEKARKTGADRVTGQYQEVLPDGTVTRVRAFEQKEVRLPTSMLQATIFRRSVIMENLLFFPSEFFVAIDTWFVFNFVILERFHGQTVRKTVYNYYYNPSSITQTAKGLEKSYRVIFSPFLRFIKDALEKCEDPTLRTEMEYLFLRNTFSSIISAYRKYDKMAVDQYYLRVRDELKSTLPYYYKNPLLWKINNGYGKGGSLACLVIAVLDRIKGKELMYFMARAGKSSSLIRKSVSAGF